eukprot:gene6172-biopygen216
MPISNLFGGQPIALSSKDDEGKRRGRGSTWHSVILSLTCRQDAWNLLRMRAPCLLREVGRDAPHASGAEAHVEPLLPVVHHLRRRPPSAVPQLLLSRRRPAAPALHRLPLEHVPLPQQRVLHPLHAHDVRVADVRLQPPGDTPPLRPAGL